MNREIERNGWNYTMIELDDGSYQMHVPLAEPAPGFDIIHILTEQEKSGYIKHGGESLSDRIADMKVNYRNYKMFSWR